VNIDQALSAVASARTTAGIFCDFDGSLSEIVAHPPKARAVRGASRTLERLARRFAIVAVVSGRPVSFLARRLHARHVRMVGLYGIEERIGRSLRVLPEVRSAHQRVEQAAAELEAQLAAIDGVWVERKGLAVSVHYRNATDPDSAFAIIEPLVATIAAERNLAPLTSGRKVIEIAAAPVDKGAVARAIIQERNLTAALVAGDDAGDIALFDAVGDLPVAVRIAVRSPEAPQGLLDRADHIVDGPKELLELFRRLSDATGR
jgi:trehalose 6-phosphate phosphatase